MRYNTSIFIFRRDLRLHDNTGLIESLRLSKKVIPIFIFTPTQILNNEYKSNKSINFMIESLKDLEEEITTGKIYFFYGDNIDVLKSITKKIKIDAIFVNRDYTPFSIKRDKEISRVFSDIDFNSYNDLLLTEPEDILSNQGTPYTKFSFFYNKASKSKIKSITLNKYKNYYDETKKIGAFDTNLETISELLKHKKNKYFLGGRAEGIKKLKTIKNLSSYNEHKNIPSLNHTSKLSPYIKYGNISIREILFEALKYLKPDTQFIKELFWRDFFTHLSFHFPQIFAPDKKNIIWNKNKTFFDKWCTGETGFPIVDAGIRELNTTGYINNRIRMIVSSFLVKDLHINWRCGEKYFAQKLIDYDPSVNNGNWQWVASTGYDSVPYFRIFNPWTQQMRFDKDCKYIKTWIPEIKNIKPELIHKPQNLYTPQIVNHKEEREICIELYKPSKK